MNGKGKSALGIVLARSLDIGKSGKIKTGTWEAGISGTGQSESVKKIAERYGVLVVKLDQIDLGIAELPEKRRKPLTDRRVAFNAPAKEFEDRQVTNDETPRQELLADIETQIVLIDALIGDLAKAALRGDKEVKISFTQPVGITTQTAITLETLHAVAEPVVQLELRQAGAATDAVRFANPGGSQKFQIVAAEPDTHYGTSVTVAVDVVLPVRKITWSPPQEIIWGTPITIESLGAKATGAGGPPMLDPPDGKLAVGDAVPLKIVAPGVKGKWLDAEEKASVKVTRVVRRIIWKLPASLAFDQLVTPELLKATASEGAGALTVTAPAGGRFTAVGDAVDLTVTLAETASHSSATLTGQVKVVKAVPELTWTTPNSALKDAKLSGTQLNAIIKPTSLKAALVYSPADGTDLAVAGNMFLRVRFPGDDKYEPVSREVRLQVMENENAKLGSDAARKGGAWTKPTSGVAGARVKAWEEDDGTDPKSLKMMGQQVMSKISQMTAEELNAELDALQASTPESASNQTGGTYPNKIWTFKNGLQVRYKKNGDIHNPGKRMFCVEVRTTPGPSTSQAEVAFKVTADGDPAAKGPGDTKLPAGITDEADKAQFKDGAQSATHLFCRPKEAQVITWDALPDIKWDTKLSNEAHLNAWALGGAVLKYYRANGTLLIAGNKLTPNSTETLKVVAEETPRYKTAEKSLPIKVGAQPGKK
jgi:hypothetical protein